MLNRLFLFSGAPEGKDVFRSDFKTHPWLAAVGKAALRCSHAPVSAALFQVPVPYAKTPSDVLK